MRYLIGIDIGTSATKTILINEAGVRLAQASKEYPLYQPANGWAEQDALDWKDAVLSTVRQVVRDAKAPKEDIKGIGLSGQMHGLVMVDGDGKPLRNPIIWCDQRSSSQAEEMLSIMSGEEWLSHTANPPMASWTAAKILWERENEPELYEKCRHILLPKDYIRYVLTGQFATDVSDASGMQLLDVENRCWSGEALEALGISEALLPQVFESQEVTGKLLPEIARECGLSEDVVVVGGAADNAAAAVGVGVVRGGESFTTLGTSGILYTHLDEYTRIPGGGLHLCCAAVPKGYFAMGVTQAAGLSLEWFKDNYCQDLIGEAKASGESVYDRINREAGGIPAGSGRLLYLPHLMGERTPHMNPKCRGAFIGLNTIHTKAHLLRAVMEGVSYSLADYNELLKEQGRQAAAIRACGGGSKSPVWRQILSDLFECPLYTLRQEEGPAFGAAILAGVGAGVFESVEKACDAFIKTSSVTEPILEEAELYRRYHRLYNKVYEDLKEDFDLLYDLG